MVDHGSLFSNHLVNKLIFTLQTLLWNLNLAVLSFVDLIPRRDRVPFFHVFHLLINLDLVLTVLLLSFFRGFLLKLPVRSHCWYDLCSSFKVCQVFALKATILKSWLVDLWMNVLHMIGKGFPCYLWDDLFLLAMKTDVYRYFIAVYGWGMF